jgi:hypothetical protein
MAGKNETEQSGTNGTGRRDGVNAPPTRSDATVRRQCVGAAAATTARGRHRHARTTKGSTSRCSEQLQRNKQQRSHAPGGCGRARRRQGAAARSARRRRTAAVAPGVPTHAHARCVLLARRRASRLACARRVHDVGCVRSSWSGASPPRADAPGRRPGDCAGVDGAAARGALAARMPTHARLVLCVRRRNLRTHHAAAAPLPAATAVAMAHHGAELPTTRSRKERSACGCGHADAAHGGTAPKRCGKRHAHNACGAARVLRARRARRTAGVS